MFGGLSIYCFLSAFTATFTFQLPVLGLFLGATLVALRSMATRTSTLTHDYPNRLKKTGRRRQTCQRSLPVKSGRESGTGKSSVNSKAAFSRVLICC